MFRRIMVPVDLGHLGKLDRALEASADLARHYGAGITYVSVTAQTPGPIAHNPREFAQKLDAFAADQAARRGIDAVAHAVVGNDPAVYVDDILVRAVEETGADLVVMASHKPATADYFWPSNGGKVATHTGASVMLVRDV